MIKQEKLVPIKKVEEYGVRDGDVAEVIGWERKENAKSKGDFICFLVEFPNGIKTREMLKFSEMNQGDVSKYGESYLNLTRDKYDGLDDIDELVYSSLLRFFHLDSSK